jgi:hypothetical protein
VVPLWPLVDFCVVAVHASPVVNCQVAVMTGQSVAFVDIFMAAIKALLLRLGVQGLGMLLPSAIATLIASIGLAFFRK